MVREKTTITFDSAVLSELRKEADQRGINLYDVVNEASKFYLQAKNSEEIDKVYAPIIEETLETTLKNFENRLASLMAKNALDSATTMFMLIQHIALTQKTPAEELYQKNRKMGVKHVQNRDELLKMLENNLKKG